MVGSGRLAWSEKWNSFLSAMAGDRRFARKGLSMFLFMACHMVIALSMGRFWKHKSARGGAAVSENPPLDEGRGCEGDERTSD